MPTGQSKLEAKIETKGATRAAKKMGEVADAQGRIVKTVGQSVKPTRELADATQKASTSGATYIELLTRLSPRLGLFADGLLKSTRIIGDLANKQINLRELTAKAAGAMRKYGGALKFALAGGAVAAGFLAISRSIAAIREESKRAEEAQIRRVARLNEEAKAQQELEAAIRATTDARINMISLTDEEIRSSAQLARQISERAGVSRDTAAQVVSELTGTGLTEKEITQAAVLRAAGRLPSFGAGAPASVVVGGTRTAILRNEGFLGDRGRDAPSGEARRIGIIRRQASTPSGPDVQLKEFLKEILPVSANLDEVANIMRTFGGSRSGIEGAKRPTLLGFLSNRQALQTSRSLGGVLGTALRPAKVSVQQALIAIQVLRSLDRQLQGSARQPVLQEPSFSPIVPAASQGTLGASGTFNPIGAAFGPATVVHNHQHYNGTYVGADGAAQAARRDSVENAARSLEPPF